MPLIPFARQSKADGQALGYSGERLENLFARQSDGMSSVVLVGRGGAVEFCDLYQPVRAIAEMGGALYAVSAGNVYKITSAGVSSIVGTVDDAETFLASSGTELAIVVNSKYYICNGSTTTQYTPGAITAPRGVAYQGGYFIVIGESGGRFDGIQVSGLDDGTTFDATEFAFAESSQDGLRGIIVDHGQVYLLGASTIEVWFNSGNADFPFSPNQGATIERGCLTGATIAKEDNGIFWVGDDRVVYRSSGGVPQVISTREVEEALAGKTIRSGFTFFDRGHKFYAVRTEAGSTWVFDITTQLWHERTTGIYGDPWICQNRATLNGRHYFGTSTGQVVYLDADTFVDVASTIKAEAVSTPLTQSQTFSVGRVTLNIRGGAGGIGRQPQVMLQTTRDGRNWSNEKWRNVGGLGEYLIASWHGLGSFCQRSGSDRFQIKLRVTDAVPRDMYGIGYE